MQPNLPINIVWPCSVVIGCNFPIHVVKGSNLFSAILKKTLSNIPNRQLGQIRPRWLTWPHRPNGTSVSKSWAGQQKQIWGFWLTLKFFFGPEKFSTLGNDVSALMNISGSALFYFLELSWGLSVSVTSGSQIEVFMALCHELFLCKTLKQLHWCKI